MAKVTRSNPKAFYDLGHRLEQLSGKVAKAGWFSTSKYEDGTPVAYIASIHEFGSPKNNIPPRPFMRPTTNREVLQWTKLLADGARAVLAGKSTAAKVMEAVGLRAAGDIARSITLVFSPPLKPATIAARRRRLSDKKTVGSLTKPLVDTGLMLATVTNTVEDE